MTINTYLLNRRASRAGIAVQSRHTFRDANGRLRRSVKHLHNAPRSSAQSDFPVDVITAMSAGQRVIREAV